MAKLRRELDPRDYDLMDIPALYRDAKWTDFNDTSERLAIYLGKLHDAVADGDGLFIFGPQRSGKSHLSTYLAKLFRSYSYTVQFARAIDIQDNIHEKNDWFDEGTFLNRYRTVDVLIIDGLGTEVDAVGRGRNRVKELIDYRLQENKLMIISTRKSKVELDLIYGDGYADYLFDNMGEIDMSKILQKRYE